MHFILLWTRDLVLFVRENGHLALYLLLSVEEAGVPLPLPGDTVVAYAGYLVTRGMMSWWLTLLASVGASTTGSIPLYWLARTKGHPWVIRYGRYLHLNAQREARLERWVQKRGSVAVLVGRLVPGMRIATTVLSGVFQIPFRSFLFYQAVSAFIWWGFWLWLGSVIGRRVANMIRLSPTHFAIAVVPILIALGVVFYVRHRAAKEEMGRLPSDLTAGPPQEPKLADGEVAQG